jgi:hypothetical protein
MYRSNIFRLLILCVFVFSACKKTNAPSNDLEQFRTDQTVATIASQLEIFRSLSERLGNSFETRAQLYKLVASAKVLSDKYGYQRTLDLANELIEEQRIVVKKKPISTASLMEFDKCHRKTDGTTDWNECNFWESVVVLVVTTVDCDQPAAGASQAEIESYYNCVQNTICKKC